MFLNREEHRVRGEGGGLVCSQPLGRWGPSLPLPGPWFSHSDKKSFTL